MEELLSDASKRAIRFLESPNDRRVFPSLEVSEQLAELEFDFPDELPRAGDGDLERDRFSGDGCLCKWALLRLCDWRFLARHGYDDIEFPWEQIDRADALKNAAGL